MLHLVLHLEAIHRLLPKAHDVSEVRNGGARADSAARSSEICPRFAEPVCESDMGQGTRRCGWKLVDRVSGNPQQQHRDATSHPAAVMTAWQVGGQLAVRGGWIGGLEAVVGERGGAWRMLGSWALQP